jgi:hypothetical protein
VIETLFSGTRKTLNLLMNVNHPTVDSVIWTVFSAKDFTRILPSCVQQFLIFLFLKRSLVFLYKDARRCVRASLISGIKEQGREENTDDLVLDVINNLILKHQGVSLNYSHR